MKKITYLFILVFHLNNVCAQDSLKLISRGQDLFNTNCTSCHGIGKEKMGPSLASISKKRPKEWLHRFVRNSQEVILSGDTYAVHLFEQYNRNVMPRFRNFSVDDINAILHYIEYRSLYPDIEENNNTGMEGEDLFQNHCRHCHSINQEGYGPALASVTKRKPKEWLFRFVKNSSKLIESGDPYAKFLYHNFNRRKMNSFEYLDDKSINAILEYIEYSAASPHHIAGVNGRQVSTTNSIKKDYSKSIVKGDSEKGYGLFLKIMLVVFASFAACIHGFLVYKLYKYLVNAE